MVPITSFNIRKLREKLPLILIAAMVAIAGAIVLLDTLEDMLIEGGNFAGTPLAELFNAIIIFTENITGTVRTWGYAGIFILMTLESSSLPIPSEVILPFAGYLVSQGLLDFWATVLVSTVAGLAGSLIDYFVGLKGMNVLAKRDRLRSLLYKEGRLEMAESWFRRYGSPMVFLSRLLPGFRTLISFPAGAMKMPLSKFVAYTTAGCLVWDVILIYLGMYVGANWRNVTGIVRYLIIAIVVALVVVLVLFVVSRKGRKQTAI